MTPTRRALVAAAVPGLLVFGVAWLWLGLALWASAIAGIVWSLVSLAVTRILYDDAEPDLAAWRAASPDLAALAPPAPSTVAPHAREEPRAPATDG